MACPSSILSPASTYTSVTSSPAGTMTFSGSSDSRAPVPDTCWLRSARMTCADTTEPSPSSAASDPNMGEEPAASVFPLCPLFKNADFAPQPTSATAARIARSMAGRRSASSIFLSGCMPCSHITAASHAAANAPSAATITAVTIPDMPTTNGYLMLM